MKTANDFSFSKLHKNTFFSLALALAFRMNKNIELTKLFQMQKHTIYFISKMSPWL